MQGVKGLHIELVYCIVEYALLFLLLRIIVVLHAGVYTVMFGSEWDLRQIDALIIAYYFLVQVLSLSELFLLEF